MILGFISGIKEFSTSFSTSFTTTFDTTRSTTTTFSTSASTTTTYTTSYSTSGTNYAYARGSNAYLWWPGMYVSWLVWNYNENTGTGNYSSANAINIYLSPGLTSANVSGNTYYRGNVASGNYRYIGKTSSSTTSRSTSRSTTTTATTTASTTTTFSTTVSTTTTFSTSNTTSKTTTRITNFYA